MDNGYIISFNEEEFEYNVNGFYEIAVKPRDINYINVGSRSTVEGFYEKANHIFPNKRGTFGYFNNSMLSGECFAILLPYLNNIDPENLDYNLYANYLVFSEIAEVYFLNKKTGEEIDNKTKTIEGELGVIVTMDDVNRGISYHHRCRKDVIGDVIGGVSYKYEDCYHIGTFHQNGTDGDILEFLHSCEEPLYQEEVEEQFYKTDI